MPALPRPHRSGVARKLSIAFALLMLIFGAAVYLAVAGVSELRGTVHQLQRDAAAMRSVLKLASAVRDQYAHMAHTIILGNPSHVSLYKEAASTVGAIAREVRANIPEQDARPIDDIVRASQELDRIFASKLLPAVSQGDTAAAAALHDEVLNIVSRAQDQVERLSESNAVSIARFGEHAQTIQAVARRSVLTLLLGALLCAVAAAIYIHRSVARPVAALAGGAARIAAGDLEIRIPVTTRDEIGRLAEQFNAMAAALKEHEAKLVATEKLASIGQVAASIAHEINNPLGVILGYVKLLQRSLPQAAAADLRIVEDEAERCRQVVEDLLDLTRTPRLEREEVDLRQLAEETVARLKTSLPSPPTEIAVAGEGHALGSARKLRQVLDNLVRNAMEAAGPRGRVAIRVGGERKGSVVLTVSDSGPGISPEARPRLFEPFFTTKPTGTGLGLAVSRAIVRAHGGELALAPSGDAAGATFQLALPDAAGGLS